MKKILIGASIATVLAVAATVLMAGAQTTPPAATATASTSAQEVLQVGPAGKVLMRGTIDSMGSGVITVASWGGDWTVNIGSGTQVLPGNDITQFKTGDFVGVQGTVSQNANWTINATLVRDWTYRAAVTQERQQNVQSARETIQSGTPRNYQGVASNLSGSSFTLTVNGAADTVNVASGAEVVNRNYLTLPFASIQSGDTVRVWGMNASGTITAQIVRDVSVPATSTSANQ